VMIPASGLAALPAGHGDSAEDPVLVADRDPAGC